VDNDFIKGLIEECEADKVPATRFREILIESLVAAISYARGDAPDLTAILDDPKTLEEIAKSYGDN
jgi:hypothetical protein